jgi:monothiol glutaredoxin
MMNPPRRSSSVSAYLNAFHRDTVEEVRATVAEHPIVVVSMAWNPHVPLVKKALKQSNIDHVYVEYGSYVTGWKRRLAIKLWSG